jgi:riboflavin kinase/FMN adenylyltransferase
MGVYAVRANVRGGIYDGVLNFGTRPTFSKNRRTPPTLELHLMDFSGSLYDEDIEASFIAHIRDEWYFSSTTELVERIAEDIRQARRIFASEV